MKKGKIIFGLSAVLSTALAVFSVNRGWALYANTIGSKEFGIQGTYPSTSGSTSGSTSVTPPEPDKYQKVTSEPASWEGTYLLVYEFASNTGYVWTGVDAANCYVSQTITDGVIYADDLSSSAIKLDVASTTGGYSIQINGGTNNGKYISGKSGSNTIVYGTTEVANSLSIDGNGTAITSNSTTMRYNNASGQDRFRYYKSGQQAVQLYKFIQGGPVVPIPLESISVTPTSTSIQTGATLPLEITYNPSNATNKNVSFVSSNTSVATVSDVGLVTAKAVGNTTITVTSEDGNHTATCFVTVSQASDVPVTSVSLSPAKVDIFGIGQTTTLTPTVYPENATNKNVSYTSSINSVATVNTSGVVTAVGAGETTVIVKTNDGGFEAESTVHVYKHSGTLTDPFDAEDAHNKAVDVGTSTSGTKYYVTGVVESLVGTFSTTNGYFTFFISSNGKNFECYKMLNGSSKAKFTSATDIEIGDTVVVYGNPFNYNSSQPEINGTTSGNYVVSVTKGGTDPVPVTGVSLPETASVSVSSSRTLTPTFTPSNATNKTCTWATSNSSVATVNNGSVRGVSEGTATITVTTNDGGFTDTCLVTVTSGGGGDIPEGYYDSITDDMRGETLRRALKDIINTSSVSVSYDWPRYQAADEDLNNSSNVLLIYARTSLSKTATDPGSSGNYWNREHTFPQSKMSTTQAKSDNHIIFASDKTVNGKRGNLKLGVISSGGTAVVDNLGRPTPCKYIANTMFDPGDTQARGEVARSTMYSAVMYDYEPTDNIETISRMLEWHNTYGIQARDIRRNEVVYGNQKNRNPFVDHPEYAERIWG